MSTDEERLHQQFGIAAILPGLRRAREVLDQQITHLESTLAALQNGTADVPKRKRTSPEAIEEFEEKVAALTGQQKLIRRDEAVKMLRVSDSGFDRLRVKLKIKSAAGAGNTMRSYRASDIERIRKAAAKQAKSGSASYWAQMTSEERKAEMAKRIAKGLGKKKPAVKMSKPIRSEVAAA